MLTSALIANPGKPVLVAPAMNTNMWTNAVTQANRRTLEERGYQFLEPGVGRLAEGVVGAGRLAEPPEIVESVRETLYRQADLANLPVLVTAGPTREMIDPVRAISPTALRVRWAMPSPPPPLRGGAGDARYRPDHAAAARRDGASRFGYVGGGDASCLP